MRALNEVLQAAKADEAAAKVFGIRWDEAAAARPATIDWLKPAFVGEQAAWLGMGDDVVAALQACRAKIEATPALAALAWWGHYRLFKAPGIRRNVARGWVNFEEAFGEEGALLWAVVLLSGVPRVRAIHAKRGIDEAVTKDTLSDVELWIREHKRKHGYFATAALGWLNNHFACELFKLGRLQFEFNAYGYAFHAWRHNTTRKVRLFAGHSELFRDDGVYYNSDHRIDADAWKSTYYCDEKVIRGHPVSPRGRVQKKVLELPAAEWTRILGPGEPTLGTHMAACGPLRHDDCGASHRMALEFFPKHFPEMPFRAFQCTSWLLDVQFEDHLKPDSNVVRYLQEFQLFPYPGANDNQHYERVFDGPVSDYATAPRDSSMRRAILDFSQAGGQWRAMGSLLFPEDLDWGQQIYRKMWPDE